MFASGVRRSWLAQATSSRRASKSRSRLAAISLNEAARSAISAGPDGGARTLRSPRARRPEASRTASIESTIERPSHRPARTATAAEAADTARIFLSSPMWNITQPDSRTTASGRQTANAASPAICRRTVGSARSATARTKPTASVAAAMATAVRIMGRACSRRPTPSAGAPGGTDRPRSSRAAGERGR